MTNLPDIKLSVIDYLNASVTLPSDITVAGRVQDDLQSIVTSTGPFVAVFTPPGPPAPVAQRLARSAVNIQVWASTEKAASDAARSVYDCLHASTGNVSSGVLIQTVEDVTTPGEQHDPGFHDLYRYTFSVHVRARNN